MASSIPRVGDTVSVPGSMHGTLKFVGPVANKRGTFAGVQLAPEYAPRGKNSGDVDGKSYFKTTVAGSGIFLPLEKAIKIDNRGAVGPATPKPTALGGFNQGGRAMTPAGAAGALAGLPKPNFSQTVGPGSARPMSPVARGAGRRESLPRPTSPMRKVAPASAATPTAVGKLATPKTRPSLGMTKSTMNGAPSYRPSPGVRGNKFSQSLRQSMATPSKARQLSPLGPEASFDEEPDSEKASPTPNPAMAPPMSMGRRKDSVLSTFAFTAQHEAEIRRLKESLEERDKQLKEQASSITEMETSLSELQAAYDEDGGGKQGRRGLEREGGGVEDDLPFDIKGLRVALRERNEKIKLLTAEFDANRVDFRMTIDALETASSETEKIYEKRVDELLEEMRSLQDRNEDVEGVAQQFKQLEELVQELEEGLEDARRGESEARGEVEFLRGEVERGRAEVRRLRDLADTQEKVNGVRADIEEEMGELRVQLNQKEDEVRGLKAIIQEMNKSPESHVASTNGNENGFGSGNPEDDHRASRELEDEIRDLKALLSQKSDREEELINEISRLRSDSYSAFPAPPFTKRNSVTEKHRSGGANGSNGRPLSERTVIPNATLWHDESNWAASPPKLYQPHGQHSRNQSQKTVMPMVEESEQKYGHEDEDAAKSLSGHTETSSVALWCEICEEGGHDILTCRNMFGSGTSPKKRPDDTNQDQQRNGRDVVREGMRRSHEDDHDARPAPLISRKGTREDTVIEHEPVITKQTTSPPSVAAPMRPDENQAGMVAGKSSGVIDADRWCALCERDGHESVDCPFEDAF